MNAIEVKLLAKLTGAIEKRRVILVRYEGLDYVTEPYLIHKNMSGNWILHTWKVGGDYKEIRGAHWANLRIDKIEEVHILNRRWKVPHEGYRPDSLKLGEVLCATAAGHPPIPEPSLDGIVIDV